jgi:hypothetical protein
MDLEHTIGLTAIGISIFAFSSIVAMTALNPYTSGSRIAKRAIENDPALCISFEKAFDDSYSRVNSGKERMGILDDGNILRDEILSVGFGYGIKGGYTTSCL